MSYKNLFQHYENCFETHGDNHKGVDWPNKEDAIKRYEIMLNIINYGNTQYMFINKKKYIIIS